MESTRRHPTGWQSYDAVADAYQRAAVPRFTPLAHDLVAAVAPAPDATVLDVGTGTGLAANVARDSLGPTGVVVGVDPSTPMLRRADAPWGLALVAGMVPGLPFRDEVIDAAIANLVLSHLPDYEAGLADVTRVLRGRGRFGCSAWGPDEPAPADDPGAQADELFDSLISSYGLEFAPLSAAVPCEDRFRERDNLESALRGAALVEIDVQLHTYRWTVSIEEWLAGREWPPRKRYARQQAGDQLWKEILDRAASELHRRFGETISSMGHVWIAIGTKP